MDVYTHNCFLFYFVSIIVKIGYSGKIFDCIIIFDIEFINFCKHLMIQSFAVTERYKSTECCHVLKLTANKDGNAFRAQEDGLGLYVQNPLKSPNNYHAYIKPAMGASESRSIMMDKRQGWKVCLIIVIE